MAQCKENIAYYQENAKLISAMMEKKGIRYFGKVVHTVLLVLRDQQYFIKKLPPPT